ncbi:MULTISPECIES: hypothetical protein [Streptomyces]|uniref:Uncharacterized protein n=1 Tax=Streptomyces apricus TaxID=1828112 RepID=A0A5B0AKM5_9ACTN|nr:hypothetical protein [Streptomyces apricus]KAA0930380.1 hypothetical protein FGF04_27695 [Streptomyces apricus]
MDVVIYGALGLFLAVALFAAVRSSEVRRTRRLTLLSVLVVFCAGCLVTYEQAFGESSGSRTDEAPVIHGPQGPLP